MNERTTSGAAGNAGAGAAASEPKKKTEKVTTVPMRVLDTTAVTGPRVHEQIINGQIRKFTFEPGKGLELEPAIALKFLKHDAFKLVNKDGEIIPYVRQPKQPEELQAGETLKLAEHETIARFDELSTKALAQRAIEAPGGEKFAAGDTAPSREALVEFLIEAAKVRRKTNVSAKPDVSADEFVPEAEVGEE